MNKDNYYVLTGAFGSGKSTVLALLKQRGFLCVNEPAREVLKEQRSFNGSGVPEKDPALFAELMYKLSALSYDSFKSENAPVIFDRGIPDLIAYAEIFGLDPSEYLAAAGEYRYNANVFCFNAWPDIYVNDDERRADFETSHKFGELVKKIYIQTGYNVVDVPFTDIVNRTGFITDKVKLLMG